MSSTAPAIEKAVAWDDSGALPHGKVNGWAVLALCDGVTSTRDRIISRLDSYNLISGLMVGVAIILLTNPSKTTMEFAALADFSNETLWPTLFYLAYVTCGTGCLLSYFSVIIFGTLFSANLRVAVRDVDVWRLLLVSSWLPGAAD
jgi:hypothetical protein